jgi:AraC-like DNA-binding protein
MEWLKIVEISISITGMINCFLVAVLLLFSKRGITKANKMLSMLLFAICLKISFALLINIQHEWKLPSMIIYYASEGGYISMGPLLFLYYRTYLKKEINSLLTFILLIPGLIPFIGFYNGYDVPLWLMQIYFTVWLVITFFQLRKYYLHEQKNQHFKLEKFWMNALFISYLLIWLVVNMLLIDFDYYFFELSIIFTLIFYVTMYLFIKNYWFARGDLLEVKIEPKAEPKRGKKVILTPEKENEIYMKLQRVMEIDKLYIDPEITLPKVAAKINSRPHNVSYVVNNRMQMTFNEYINSYRINDIKSVITKKEFQDMKIASLAFDYGFNTISAFNTAFKKFTNYTPSEYRTVSSIANQN